MSFDPSLPTDVDKVRLRVGDTDVQNELLADDTYSYFLTIHDDLNLAGSMAARVIAAKLARDTDYAFSTLGVDASQAYEHYMELAEDLESEASKSMNAGPIHVHSGDDARDPEFDVGMHDID